MDQEIRNYIETICSHIDWKNYRPPVKAELQSHIEDSIRDFMLQGRTEEQAKSLTLKNMGNPDILGEQLNEAYRPVWNITLICVIFFSLIVFSVLEYFAILEMTGEKFFLAKAFFNILLGFSAAVLLFINDWSSDKRINSFTLKAFFSITLFCIILNFIPFSDKRNVINGMLLLFPLLCCCFMDRLKGKRVTGFLIGMVTVILPILISYYVQSFAGMVMLSISGWSIMIFTIKNNWFRLNRKGLFYIFASLPFFFLFLFILLHKMDNMLLNRNGVFVREIFKESVMCGKGNAGIINTVNNKQLADYPITFMTANYGYLILIAYILFFAFILFEIVKICHRQQTFLSRLFMLSILTGFVAEFVFSLLLNIGFPLAKGITVPFFDLNFGIIIKTIQLGAAEKLDCFGNYMFSDYSDNRLFDVEAGKIIIYCK